MAFNVDEDLGNADWTKSTWDLLDIEDEEDLAEHLDSIGMSVEHFKMLPVYTRNVDKVDWLGDL